MNEIDRELALLNEEQRRLLNEALGDPQVLKAIRHRLEVWDYLGWIKPADAPKPAA